MKILIFGINYAPEQAGIAVYTSGFAEDLVRRGEDVTVLCAPPHFPSWRIKEGYSANRYRSSIENGVRVIRCPTYIPQSTGALRRILHYLTYTLSSLIAAVLLIRRTKPDVVLCVAPALLSASTALMVAKLAKARTWLHVQDFEIEAAFATGVLDEGPAATAARNAETFLLSKFDRVSTISRQMTAKLASKGVCQKRIVEFRNWSDLKEVAPLKAPSAYRNRWNIGDKHVALYSGSIGNKQGIELIIETARMLKNRDDLVFVICGEGPNRRRLEGLAAGLPNVLFHDLQPRNQLSELLGLATVHLLPQLADAADSVLPSKLTNILASGRPVIATASPGTGLYDEVQRCGITTSPGKLGELVRAVSRLIDDPKLCEELGSHARSHAEMSVASDAILDRAYVSLRNLAAGGERCAV